MYSIFSCKRIESIVESWSEVEAIFFHDTRGDFIAFFISVSFDMLGEAFIGGMGGHADIEAVHSALVMRVGFSEFLGIAPDTFGEFYDVDIVGEFGFALGR